MNFLWFLGDDISSMKNSSLVCMGSENDNYIFKDLSNDKICILSHADICKRKLLGYTIYNINPDNTIPVYAFYHRLSDKVVFSVCSSNGVRVDFVHNIGLKSQSFEVLCYKNDKPSCLSFHLKDRECIRDSVHGFTLPTGSFEVFNINADRCVSMLDSTKSYVLLEDLILEDELEIGIDIYSSYEFGINGFLGEVNIVFNRDFSISYIDISESSYFKRNFWSVDGIYV